MWEGCQMDVVCRYILFSMILNIFVQSLSLCIAGKPEDADTPAHRKERELMVETQIKERGVSDERVLQAMRKVPRHLMIPESRRRQAYGDHPVSIGYGQTISQPYIVAYMTEVLQLKEDSKVLEIGTGSGYQAAILAEITTNVYSIEIIPELAEFAKSNLYNLGYTNVHLKEGDGYEGWESEAPWDAIIVTAAAEHVPPPLIKQLKPGGRMCIPVGTPFGTQFLQLVEKSQDGRITTRNLMPVIFVPLTRKSK
jgi:protein-L-isoaspartate(D-aspartate) O-methyltransferase